MTIYKSEKEKPQKMMQTKAYSQCAQREFIQSNHNFCRKIQAQFILQIDITSERCCDECSENGGAKKYKQKYENGTNTRTRMLQTHTENPSNILLTRQPHEIHFLYTPKRKTRFSRFFVVVRHEKYRMAAFWVKSSEHITEESENLTRDRHDTEHS